MKTITKRKWESILLKANKKMELIPSGHVNKRENAKIEEIKALIEKGKRKIELKVGKMYEFVIVEKINVGTKKWQKWEERIYLEDDCKYLRDTNCFHVFDRRGREHRISKHKILSELH